MPSIRTRLLASAVVCALSAGPAFAHVQLTLRDADGADVTTTQKPVSFRKSCGTCHDIDYISQGYHFQQGRTRRETSGQFTLQVSDTFNADKPWLLSDGMYGKT